MTLAKNNTNDPKSIERLVVSPVFAADAVLFFALPVSLEALRTSEGDPAACVGVGVLVSERTPLAGVGDGDGAGVAVDTGFVVGAAVGTTVGMVVGTIVGTIVGTMVGTVVGAMVGTVVGVMDGAGMTD